MTILRKLHRWLGLLLALPLVLQGLSGLVLAIYPMLDAAPPRAAAPPADIPAVIAAAAHTMPDLAVRRYELRPSAAPEVDIGNAAQPPVMLRVFVDPASLQILAVRPFNDAFYRSVHLLHEHFLLPQYGGRSFIGWVGAGLLFLALSGIPLWWPSAGAWRAAFTVSRRTRGHRLQRQLHGAAGIWIVLMLIVQSATGMTLAFPDATRALLGMPMQSLPRGEGRPRESAPPDIPAILAAAQAAVPGAQVTAMRIFPGRPTAVTLRGADDIAVTVMLAPNGRVTSIQDPRSMGFGATVLASAHALHFGEAFGPVFGAPLWRLLICLAGLVLPGMALTGAAMWLMRRRQRLRLKAQRRAALAAD